VGVDWCRFDLGGIVAASGAAVKRGGSSHLGDEHLRGVGGWRCAPAGGQQDAGSDRMGNNSNGRNGMRARVGHHSPGALCCASEKVYESS
jgi:hypothetical protein